MRLIVLIAAFGAFATQAMAGDWREIGNSDTFIVGVDRSQIRKTGNLAFIWAIQSSLNRYRVSRIEVDCQKETLTTLTFSEFTHSGSYERSNDRRGLPETVYPDSTGQTLMRAGCESGAFFADESYQTPSDFHRMALRRLTGG